MSVLKYSSEFSRIRKEAKNRKIELVVIGASIGGPKALEKLLTNIPEDIGVPILIVQHMFREMTGKFAQRLDSISRIKVQEAKDGEKIKAGVAYIAKGDYHMTLVRKDKILLDKGSLVNGVRPAVDNLFISAASFYEDRLLSVVLTGMGKDGAKGTMAVKENKGFCICEAEETCFIYGMPRACRDTGMIDVTLPINLVSDAIVTLVKG
ncbi:MAG: CheB methylesterase domain-containing protein [Sarcina sp.]